MATATTAALFGMECTVFMGEEDIRRQAPNVHRMELLGAKVVSVKSGAGTLKDAMNEAMRHWSSTVEDTFYVIGSVAGPHPYPPMVRDFQRVIGLETRPLLFLTFLLYVFPVIMLIIGAAIGNTLGPRFNMDPSLCAMGAGFFLFAAAFFIIRLKNNSLSKQNKYRPFLVRKRPATPLNPCHS